jgi:pimeloyl-ACP methyl ester carboxylesterase
MSPVPDLQRQTESQFVALLRLHREFFEDCAAGVLRCPPEPEAVFQQMVEQGGSLSAMLQFALANWKFLLGSGPGRELAAQSLRVHVGEEPPPEMMAGMAAAAAVVPSFNVPANLSTNCADDINEPLTAAEADQLLLSYFRVSSVFVFEATPALTCSAWEVPRDPLPVLEFEPRVPPLVIGGTRDILTPYALAQETVRAIEGAALLTSEHYGHSALNLGLPDCVMDHVLRYLETLEPPPAGARCEPPPAR